jgi:hypothetical protein
MLFASGILYTADSVKIDTLNRVIGKTNEFVSTGGIQPAYFLGTVLFIIFIMIAMLLIKIINIKHDETLRINKIGQ